MATDLTKKFLQEYFRDHDSLVLYKEDGSAFTFSKRNNVILNGGYHKLVFKDYDELMDFYHKRNLCLKPVITVG